MLTGTIGTVLIMYSEMSPLPEDNNIEVPSTRSRIMVNDQLYWSSANPPDGRFSEGSFSCIGEVKTKVNHSSAKNFQAYDIAEGTKIYYSSKLPHVIYLENSGAHYRYATLEASKDYLYHNETVYVSLSSVCSWEYERYLNDYIPLYGEQITVDSIPERSIYIGETKFVGYNMFVYDELETNAFQHPVPIYQDSNQPKLLYVGDNNMIYVPQVKY